ncbi:flavodoxin domain-containing protein [Carnobacterium pleistocenium]|uniref:flavodoxin domain-containing protein n=1 Tax=Carnobacterium pleistocenium TaxID=181073 RepID=UPI00054DF43F|nr:flavodoxin domain-containing protein [Carnobacterium pleistocenium]
MKNIVLYKSKYGNTFQYATWIAEELDWEIRDFSKFKKSEIKNYNTIIFGSGVYIGRMNNIRKVLEWFKEKPIIIFACAGNNNVEKDITDIKTNNFNKDQLAFHTFFYLPGGIDFSKVKGIVKLMINIFIKIIEKKKNKKEDEEAILESYYHPTSYVDKKHIQAIVSYTKKI